MGTNTRLRIETLDEQTLGKLCANRPTGCSAQTRLRWPTIVSGGRTYGREFVYDRDDAHIMFYIHLCMRVVVFRDHRVCVSILLVIRYACDENMSLKFGVYRLYETKELRVIRRGWMHSQAKARTFSIISHNTKNVCYVRNKTRWFSRSMIYQVNIQTPARTCAKTCWTAKTNHRVGCTHE